MSQIGRLQAGSISYIRCHHRRSKLVSAEAGIVNQEIQPMAIISQNAIRHGLFTCQSATSRKSRRAGRVSIQNKANFLKAKMNTNSFARNDYENEPQRRLRKSKANQSQFSNRKAKDRVQSSVLWTLSTDEQRKTARGACPLAGRGPNSWVFASKNRLTAGTNSLQSWFFGGTIRVFL